MRVCANKILVCVSGYIPSEKFIVAVLSKIFGIRIIYRLMVKAEPHLRRCLRRISGQHLVSPHGRKDSIKSEKFLVISPFYYLSILEN